MSEEVHYDRRPQLVEVAGRSMEPSLGLGSRVWVTPDSGNAKPGDIALIRGREGWILHRVVATHAEGDEVLVFHRGDAGGGIGCCPATAIAGTAVAFLDPSASFPKLESMGHRFLSSFVAAQRRVRVFVRLRRLARFAGLHRSVLRPRLARLSQALLNG